jgi:hypothetical protein
MCYIILPRIIPLFCKTKLMNTTGIMLTQQFNPSPFSLKTTFCCSYENLTVISDCLKHDTVAVHLFQWHLKTFLKVNTNQPLEKIIYFSNGSAAQYKDWKNFLKSHYTRRTLGAPANWHFFAISHHKSACDVLVEPSKDLQHKPVCNDLIQTKL